MRARRQPHQELKQLLFGQWQRQRRVRSLPLSLGMMLVLLLPSSSMALVRVLLLPLVRSAMASGLATNR